MAVHGTTLQGGSGRIPGSTFPEQAGLSMFASSQLSGLAACSVFVDNHTGMAADCNAMAVFVVCDGASRQLYEEVANVPALSHGA